jgi:2-polyprenyl-3-methyl-5-hydroxy-6-metoxy-1,4-benzoquinol methylase
MQTRLDPSYFEFSYHSTGDIAEQRKRRGAARYQMIENRQFRFRRSQAAALAAPADASSSGFDRVLRLLEGDLEPLRIQARELRRRYGQAYEQDAVFILEKLDQFARQCGDDLETVLRHYVHYLEQVVAERRRYRCRTGGYGKTERELEALWHDVLRQRQYLYTLTSSTVFNRSRYELLHDFRSVLAAFPPRRGTILEIGAGNCLSASLASAYGRVTAFERNELSEAWRRILDPDGEIDLRIERYRLAEPQTYDLTIMIEILEHVADPSSLLQGAYDVLEQSGLAYVTFAIRMPQEDHLYEFTTVGECREMIRRSAFHIWHEQCLIDTYYPFEEEERWLLADDEAQAVVYCCLLAKARPPAGDPQWRSFTASIET